MTTLWPIPEDARDALEDGEHVLLKPAGQPNADGGVVIAFEENVKDCFVICDWEPDDGWKHDD